jgi:hypothetical protein
MGLDKHSAGSFEEMAEQNEAAEVKTAETTPEATPVAEAVATEPVTTEETGDKTVTVEAE